MVIVVGDEDAGDGRRRRCWPARRGRGRRAPGRAACVAAASMATTSWVLSPHSARKAATKAVRRASISRALAKECDCPYVSESRAEADRDRGEHGFAGGLVEPLAADRVAQPVEIEAGRAAARLGADGALERVGEADDRDAGRRPRPSSGSRRSPARNRARSSAPPPAAGCRAGRKARPAPPSSRHDRPAWPRSFCVRSEDARLWLPDG